MDRIFEKGDPVSPNYFIGDAWCKMLVTDEAFVYDSTVYDVEFAPGARNNWHSHPAGQLLLITGGEGYYQERGKSARLLTKGDVVEIPPGVEHWHGATSNSTFFHIGISPNVSKGPAVWLEPVSDEEYGKLDKSE